eukprot:3325981-Prymnesium_polylepis.1
MLPAPPVSPPPSYPCLSSRELLLGAPTAVVSACRRSRAPRGQHDRGVVQRDHNPPVEVWDGAATSRAGATGG